MNVIIFLVFIAIFIFLLVGLFRIAEGRRKTETRPRTASPYTPESQHMNTRRTRLSTQQPSTTRSKKTALQAMQRARYDVGEKYVRVTDIGLLEYRGTNRPRLLREEQIRANSDYLRPFVELWLPYRSRGMVRFELIERVDGRTRLHFADEDEYDLKAGINALLPGTWLPLQDKVIDYADRWRLRILVGHTLLADHRFGWREAIGGSEIQRHMANDGEISSALQQALSAQQGESISLDDLLGG